MRRRLLAFVIYSILAFNVRPLCAQEAVHWFEWDTNAFQAARKEEKPILLYLTSSWCHWVTVMDSETFTDPDIIQSIQKAFIPVRVNSDLRPDLNARYNMGGWPSTVFLTPEGHVLAAATFLSAKQMKQILPEIERLHIEKRNEFNEKAERELREFEADLTQAVRVSRDADLAPSFIDKVLASILLEADDERGGFGKEEKSPVPEVTEFLFLLEEVRPDVKASKFLASFLDGERKLFDEEMGGFFRYAAEPDWTEPQYEKMLGANALVLRDFLWSQRLVARPGDERLISGTLQYLDEFLWDKALGGFFGSQSSDLVLETGSPGADSKSHSALIPGSVYYHYPRAKRLALGTPPVDRHIYSNSCAQIISVLLDFAAKRGGSGERRAAQALRALDVLMESSFDSGRGMKHVFPEPVPSALMLEDQVWTLKSLLEAWEFSKDKKYELWFSELVSVTEKKLGTGSGLFYDMEKNQNAFGALRKQELPFVENCLAARIYLHAHRLTGNEVYRKKAETILLFLASRYSQFSVYAAAYGSALIDWFYPVIEVKVSGKKSDPKAQVLLEAAAQLPSNRLRLSWQDEEGDPKVLICVGKQCLVPVETPDKVPVLFDVARKVVQAEPGI